MCGDKMFLREDFIQNRLIIFPALWKHRGLDPVEHATPRVTLAFKTSKI
jgi:hypothetical protein